MYPITINLLSTEKRKYLNRMIYVQFIKNTLISIVFVFCISGITLLGGQSVLQEYFNDVSNILTTSGEMHADKNKQIRAVNLTLNKAESVQQIHNIWSNIIVDVGNAVPNDIVINNLIFKKSEKKISIIGAANSRLSLLKFKENLNSLDFVKNTDIPLSQLTEKEDIKFSITTEMK